MQTFTLTHTISLTGVRSGAELYNGRTLYVLGLPSAGSWDFYSTCKALSLCVSQARLALQRGAQAVIFDITDDPGAAQEVSICVPCDNRPW